MTFDELLKIADDREAWAAADPASPLAEEWRLVAQLANEVIAYRERFGAVAEYGFLST